MKHRVKVLIWFWTGLALSLGMTSLLAGPGKNPYSEITARNVFGLRSPPSPVIPHPEPPLPVVKLVGISTFHGARALLKITMPAEPRQPPKETSCILTVGQRHGPVEVLAINDEARTATVNNSGTMMVLELGKDPVQPHPQPHLGGPLPHHNQYVSSR
jgi:hypothetical protein